jgi:Asp-tRNA(Asn)/Glu-tRNA(Gln) amidotransferase A subunit family amidase
VTVPDDLTWLAATDLESLITSRQISPVELVRHCLARIDDLDPGLRAFITVAADQALEQALEAERDIARGVALGPLHGVPVALKDECWTEGIVSSGGSLVFAKWVPSRDGTVTERLRQAGAIILGKTQLPEFAAWPRSKNRVVRESVNPWDRSRISGASSGGSAAALAASMLPLTVGSDGGGSIRIPSALCGVVGLYPTPGRVPAYGSFSYSPAGSLGPMARSVRDVALLYSVLAGPDPRDGWALPDQTPDVLPDLEQGVSGTRIAWTEDFGWIRPEDGVAAAARGALIALEGLGARVQSADRVLPHPWGDGETLAALQRAVAEAEWDLPADPGPLPEFGPEDETWLWSLFAGGAPVTASARFRDTLLLHRQLLSPHSQLSMGQPPPVADPDAEERQRDLSRSMEALFEEHDVICSPTMAVIAPPAREGWATPYPDQYMGTNFTFLANATGCPAASVPCGLVNGLPVGLQIVGRPRDEATVLRVAYAVEEALGLEMRPAMQQ